MLDFDKILLQVEHQRTILYQKFGDYLLRPYLRGKYHPLSEKKRYNKKNRETAKQETRELLRELFFFTFFAVLIYVLVLCNLDFMYVYSNLSLKAMLEGEFTDSMSYSDANNNLE